MRAFSEAFPWCTATGLGEDDIASSVTNEERPEPDAPPLEVTTNLFVPTGEAIPAEYERIALIEAEVASLFRTEK